MKKWSHAAILVLILGSSQAGAAVLYFTDFEDAAQPGGIGMPITMGGTAADGVAAGALAGGAGTTIFRLDPSIETAPVATGLFPMENAGANPSSNLASAVANSEYFEFTLTAQPARKLDELRFSMVKHGFAQFAGVTLRSSVDNYTADLVTVTDSAASGIYPAIADLSSLAGFSSQTSVTFRFYLYDQYTGSANRRIGIDDIRISQDGVPDAAGLLAGYDFENPEEATRGYAPELVASGVSAGLFKSSFIDRPHYASETLGGGVGDHTGLPFDTDPDGDRSIAFRESEWGMNNNNTLQDAVDQKWYFEFSLEPERHRRLSLSALHFTAQIANAGKSADRWFLTSSLDGFETDAMLDTGEITASSTNDDPAADADFQDVSIDLAGQARFQNLAREVTFRLYWTADNANTNNDNFNMTRIDKVGVYGSVIDTSALPTNTYTIAADAAGPDIRAVFAAAASNANPAIIQFAANAVYRSDKYDDEFNQIPIQYTQDLVVEGNGSTLVINPENRSFLVWRCRDVTIRGFDIDFDPVPWAQGEVLSVDAANSNFVFQIADGYEDLDPDAVEALRSDWDNSVFVLSDSMLFSHIWVDASHVEAVPGFPGRYTVTVLPEHVSKLAGDVQPGMLFVLNRHQDLLDGIDREKRDELGYYRSIGSFTFVIRHSRHIAVEDVNFYAFAGRAWNVFDSDDVDLNRITIRRKPGTDRAVSGVRGGVIIKEMRSGPVIRNSRFEATMDDSMNRSDTPCYLLSVSNQTATLRFAGNKWGDAIFEPGSVIEFRGRAGNETLGTGIVLETIRDSHRLHRIRLDSIPAGVQTTNDVPLDQASLLYTLTTGRLAVSNCTFGTQLKKAIICRPPALIEDCRFEESNYGIHAYVTSDDEEGPFPRSHTYRNLRFKNVGIGAIVLYKPGGPQSGIDQEFVIDGVNIYQDGSAVDSATGISISGMNGVTVSNSTIRFAADVDPSKALLVVNNSLNVVQTNNWFIDERLPSTDSDDDGLPDWWEQAYFGGTGQDADDDPDGDGASNLDEFLAATHPADPDSVFNMSMDGNTVSWSSEYGRTYTLQQSTNLVTGQWTGVATNQAPTPPLNSVSTAPDGPPVRFYRIEAAP